MSGYYEVLSGTNRIIYKVDGDIIYVHLVVDARSDLEDILARRLGLQYFSWSLAAEAAPIVAEYLARDLSWSSSHKDSAIREYLAKIARMQEALSSPPATAT